MRERRAKEKGMLSLPSRVYWDVGRNEGEIGTEGRRSILAMSIASIPIMKFSWGQGNGRERPENDGFGNSKLIGAIFGAKCVLIGE